ncbi:JAK3 kinase, partial [Picathartes gymnocephalus]|nr:JAK3 kinase [Picathartes gymnocephalus]
MAPLGEETPLIGGRSCSLSSAESGTLQVFLYHRGTPAPRGAPGSAAGTLSFSFGQYTAEELCVRAARACGVLPVCHPLFALATEDLSCWFPPNHLFTVDESRSQLVVYRIRFFFPNWYGLGQCHRFQLLNDRASPVLDYPVIDYLFAQSRSDFLEGRVAVGLSLPTQEQCLSLAVLDMLRIASEQRQSPAQVCSRVSYKSCLPAPLRRQIQQHNFVTRQRLRRRFGKSLRRLGSCRPDGPHLKLKYLLDLERLQRRRTEEIFHVRSPGSAAPIAIHVSGDSGVAWSCGGSEVLRGGWVRRGELRDGLVTPAVPSQSRQHFCDFPDIADISIKQAASRDGGPVENRLVTLTKADNRVLVRPGRGWGARGGLGGDKGVTARLAQEVEFPTLREARSFVALLDGYYRLTADAQHYFCREVAPPRLLEDLENQCHGPISAEFAVNKLEAAGGAPGLFLLRRSPQDFDSYLLTVCVQTRSGRDYRRCRIRRDEDGHLWLSGVARRFCSLRELLGTYGHRGLQAEGAQMRLEVACPPRPKGGHRGLWGVAQGDRDSPWRCPRVPQGESLGQGSFTQIYKGVRRDQDEEEGPRQTPVVLKVMDSSHRNCLESFLEAASTMSQLSHKHLVLLHGVSLGKDSECHGRRDPRAPPEPFAGPPLSPAWPPGVMVQEHVRHGPLDLYLRKNRAAVTTGWKLTVAKQLAYALNYL